MVEDNNETITPLDNQIGSKVPLDILKVPSNAPLVGAIELGGVDTILANEALWMPSNDDEDGDVG